MKIWDKSMQKARAAWVHYAPCGARCRSGLPCKNLPVRGKKRCRMHGGMSQGRPQIHGRFSQFAIEALRQSRSTLHDLEQALAQRLRKTGAN
jgi:hypothetical protein